MSNTDILERESWNVIEHDLKDEKPVAARFITEL